MATVFDYSSWRPDPRQLKAAGIVGVCRYLCDPGTSANPTFARAKLISKPEYDSLLAAGLTVTLNWEQDKASWKGGYPVGRQHGILARSLARQLGHPDSRPIIQSVDTNWTAAELGAALAYQHGFNDGGGQGPQGMYGTASMLAEAFTGGLIVLGWQTQSRAWNGNSQDSPLVALIQHTSKSFPQFPASAYDENTVHRADWGQMPEPLTPATTCLFGYRCPWVA